MDDLIRSLDQAMAESARLCGAWLVCGPGCTSCCMGSFPITPLDALRLKQGLSRLETTNPPRASLIRTRAREYSDAEDEPCPVLDLDTGLCGLYDYRPVTCRIFGPPILSRATNSVGVCELCFHGATGEQIEACSVDPDPEGLEAALLIRIEQAGGASGDTLVAFALR